MSDDSKPKDIMIIGHVDHGKHTLTAALTALAARRPVVVDMVHVAPSPCYDDGNKRTYRGHIKKSERWR